MKFYCVGIKGLENECKHDVPFLVVYLFASPELATRFTFLFFLILSARIHIEYILKLVWHVIGKINSHSDTNVGRQIFFICEYVLLGASFISFF